MPGPRQNTGRTLLAPAPFFKGEKYFLLFLVGPFRGDWVRGLKAAPVLLKSPVALE